MIYYIRELRDKTGLTQKAFAQKYWIPLSTLRKWEQGEASPPSYVVEMLAKSLPCLKSDLQEFRASDGRIYYYDPVRNSVTDQIGNTIIVHENLNKVKKENLFLYLRELFDDFYEIQDKFDRDCRFDMKEDIIWS